MEGCPGIFGFPLSGLIDDINRRFETHKKLCPVCGNFDGNVSAIKPSSCANENSKKRLDCLKSKKTFIPIATDVIVVDEQTTISPVLVSDCSTDTKEKAKKKKNKKKKSKTGDFSDKTTEPCADEVSLSLTEP